MELSSSLICPACRNNSLTAKYEATYVYSYCIDSGAPGRQNEEEFLPFLFDNREQKGAKEYIECSSCGAQYPCSFGEGNKGVNFTILQKAIRSDHVDRPEFFG